MNGDKLILRVPKSFVNIVCRYVHLILVHPSLEPCGKGALGEGEGSSQNIAL